MKKLILILTSLTLLLSISAAAEETVHMRDGSILQGTVLSLDDDLVVLKTQYADALELPRGQVAAIVLDSGFELPGTRIASMPSADMPVVLDGTGTLEITFTGRQVRTSMHFQKEKERERVEQTNSIHVRVYVDDEELYTFIDDEMDKEFKKGKLIYLRNTCSLQPISIEVPAGEHDIRVVVSNPIELALQDEDQSDLVSAEVFVERIMVKPDRSTRLIIKGSGSRLGYGNYSMELLTTR
ncbi:MAG: hypothetical protein GY835_15665 [bacterium]|nr:hypothetical protein [bacterium]